MTRTDPTPTSLPLAPPLDPELVPPLEMLLSALPALGPDTLEEVRSISMNGLPGAEEVDWTAGGRVRVEEIVVPSDDGDTGLQMTVLKPAVGDGPWPLVYFLHGGGMVIGGRHIGLESLLRYAAEGHAVVASLEYRVAPEHPDPTPVNDCYTGLCWAAKNSDLLEIDADRILVSGISAGGGLAAGIALIARDRGFPHLTHQILCCPMLDDRFITHSSRMVARESAVWTSYSNEFGWSALLGDRRGGSEVSEYAAPARSENLADLPRTYIDVSSVEVFRDEDLEYAQRLSQAGVSVDFHLWGGGFHGYEMVANAALTQAAGATRHEFFLRALER
ncbi:hypothetical protein GCM10007304_48230 [Rhodococcoides trifolii]|uniref:Alpha/beta hydrolase fold-3 domain-containing protein n=1 Tax=Rhodococcoides trifolii TaxID=908250 RepID=A0A917G8F8_9NOCA|nr:alpha/beta hydrolase [Rhodococcus trifolii]GGG28728.1 hypothetical protein GCM10007304_48230 [Rhodococcus trifolii]